MFHGLTLRDGGGEERESEWERQEEEKERETYARSVNRQITSWQNDETNLQHHKYKGSLTVLYLTPVTFIFKEKGGGGEQKLEANKIPDSKRSMQSYNIV